jgi:adenine-specific DNA-methyltransferase
MTEIEVTSTEAGAGAEPESAAVPVAEPAKIEVTRPELIWPGKYDANGKRREVERITLPFQVIERVNESRATRDARAERGLTLFDVWKGDEGETFEEGWRNKLIWGDNKLVASSLLEQYAGKVDLIYIDPPFATGTDFSLTLPIGDSADSIFKEQSLIEEKAYRDTWGEGLKTYLTMLTSRLVLARELLSTRGSLYVHLDPTVVHYVKVALDEIFGSSNGDSSKPGFRNELIWCYSGGGIPKTEYPRKHDVILWYSKGTAWTFNVQYRPYSEGTVQRGRTAVKGPDAELRAEGTPVNDWWPDIKKVTSPTDPEKLYFPNQKSEDLLARIIAVATEPGQLVADFFCGSGTTMAVAEKLGRRWIGCDLGRYAVHVSRKRLLGIENCRPFEILNLGRYERRYWQVATFGEDLDDDGVISLYEYIAFILKLYGATPTSGLQHLHGKHGGAFVHVGAVESPVTIDEVAACVEECVALKARELHVLGWEWEMGMNDLVSEEAKRRGVKVVLRHIPREVMEEQAAAKGDVQFFELAYLEASTEPAGGGREFTVALENFVIPNPELVPDDVREKITKWSDYVDYWAVDWDFRDDTFMQGWVTFRTRKDRKLGLRSDPHAYAEPGEYAVMVKVIDVFGNDTSKILRVNVG